jgi:ATP-binding cassette subfamily B protein
MRRNNNIVLYRRLWQQLRPYWRHLAGIFLLSLLSPPLALMAPVPLKIAVDSVIQSHSLPHFLDVWLPETLKQSPQALLLVAALLLVGVALLTQLRDLANAWLIAYTGEKFLRGFRAQLFRHVQRLSLSYHDTKGTADTIYRIQYDAVSVQRIAVEGITPFISSALTLIAMVYVTIQINMELALVALSVSPVIFILSRTYRRRLRHQSREVKKIESSALSVVQEVLGAIKVVKAFGQESREDARFAQKSNEGMRARLQLVLSEGRFGLLAALLTALGTASVLFVGVHGVLTQGMTLGDLLLVMAYVAKINDPLKTISKKIANMQSYLAGAERTFAILDESPDVDERPNARPLIRARGAMTFRDVSFAYEHNRPVLQNISFEVEPGTCLGIAGATGAGKTTIVNLLTRFYDPVKGEILLDGVDVRDYRLIDLRNQFAIVLQEPVLFSTSIAENIAYARADAREDEIIAAAKAANIHDFISRLPEGYETLVGERGMRLSGGERQRISIARAFLKNAPILILDEPTSSVDVKTETAIVEAMERLTHGRTTFIITHRESTLKHSDLVLRVENGRVVTMEPTQTLPEKRLSAVLQKNPLAVRKAYV